MKTGWPTHSGKNGCSNNASHSYCLDTLKQEIFLLVKPTFQYAPKEVGRLTAKDILIKPEKNGISENIICLFSNSKK